MSVFCHRILLRIAILCATTILLAFCNNGYSLDTGPISISAVSEIGHLHDKFWISVADSQSVVFSESNTELAVQVKTKNPSTGAVLGGVLGFGSGQYYSKRWTSGTVFLVFDGIAAAFLVAGAIGIAQNDDEPFEELGDALVGTVVVAPAAAGLIVSHIVQAIWGARATRRYNMELERTSGTWGNFVLPAESSTLVGLTYHY